MNKICLTIGRRIIQRSAVVHTFYAKSTDLIKVIAVQMRIHTEQPSYNRPYSITEVPRKRNTWNNSQWSNIRKKVPYIPILLGKTASSSSNDWAQFISASTYSGAGSFVGRLYLTPSSQRYSYLPYI